MPLSSAVITLALALGAVAPTLAHADQEAPGPVPVVVSVDRDTESLHEGEKVTYQIEIANRTEIDFPTAVVAQQMPGGLRAVSVSDGGTTKGTKVEWGVHLAPKGTVHRRMTAVVVKRDKTTQIAHPANDAVDASAQFSTTTCFRQDTEARPMSCTSDHASPPTRGTNSGSLWLGAGAAVLTAGALGGFVLVRRRGVGRQAKVAT